MLLADLASCAFRKWDWNYFFTTKYSCYLNFWKIDLIITTIFRSFTFLILLKLQRALHFVVSREPCRQAALAKGLFVPAHEWTWSQLFISVLQLSYMHHRYDIWWVLNVSGLFLDTFCWSHLVRSRKHLHQNSQNDVSIFGRKSQEQWEMVHLIGDGASHRVDGLDGPEGDIVWKILSDKKAVCYALTGSLISVLVEH